MNEGKHFETTGHPPDYKKLRQLMETFMASEMKKKQERGGAGYDKSFDDIALEELLSEDLDALDRLLNNRLSEDELAEYRDSVKNASPPRQAFAAWLTNWFAITKWSEEQRNDD